jgi:hypothetical protein
LVQAADGVGIGALVISRFLEGRADQGAAIAAGHEVDLGRSDYVT